MSKAAAIQKISEFKKQKGASKWKHINRGPLADGLTDRVNHPDNIAQRQTPLCGPASLVRALAKNKPLEYANAAIDLFNKGQARIGKLTIKPGSELLRDPVEGNTHPADWIMLASIRDSDNWFLSPSGIFGSGLAGVTRPSTIERWFKSAGFSKVVHKTHVVAKPIMSVLAAELAEANRLHNRGYYVLFIVDGDVLDAKTQDDLVSMYPDHWIVQKTAIKDGGLLAYDQPIRFTAWSWGQLINVPEKAEKPLKKREFLHKYYGFIAARA